MFQNDRILALIPARGGSKGIKGKNIYELHGKPLIAYSIEAAMQCRYIDKTVVTTDSPTIAEVAKKYGAEVPFMRPDEFAKDTSPTIEAVMHAIRELKRQGEEFDVCVLLQPTSPLRLAEDIDNSVQTFYKWGGVSLLSVSEVRDHPILIRSISEDGTLKRLLDVSSTCRRQDMPKYYRVNGAIYINRIDELRDDTILNENKIPYILPYERAVDIDEPDDISKAERYLEDRLP